MTPAGFLRFIGEIRGFSGSELKARAAAAISRAGLETVVDQRIETLSKGYKRRVGIAQAILHNPDVLIMDEPTDGLDPNQKHHVRELIREMAADKAIIVSTHILEEVEAVCTRAVVIAKGRIVADGTAEDLLRRLPHHRSVLITVPHTHAEQARKLLASHADVDKVETVSKIDGLVELRAIPKQGKEPAVALAALLRDKGLPYSDFHIERGKLDDVFRTITAPSNVGQDT